MGFLGCYDGVLYCDVPTCRVSFESSDHQTASRFLADARSRGWSYNPNKEAVNHGNGHCLCPKHSGKKLKEQSHV
jgi:hypothetical protein